MFFQSTASSKKLHLNLLQYYEFRKDVFVKNSNRLVFWHPYFLRDSPKLLLHVHRLSKDREKNANFSCSCKKQFLKNDDTESKTFSSYPWVIHNVSTVPDFSEPQSSNQPLASSGNDLKISSIVEVSSTKQCLNLKDETLKIVEYALCTYPEFYEELLKLISKFPVIPNSQL